MPRPAILDPLFRSLRSLKGVGPQLGALLNRYFGAEGQDGIALDVLMHMPSGVIDRRRMEGVANAVHNHVATLKVHIDRHVPPPPGRRHLPHRVKTHDETGELDLVFFHAKGNWVEKSLPVGEDRYVSARSASSRARSRSRIPISSSRRPNSRTCRWSNRSIR